MKDDQLQLDYEQTNELIRMLTDVRFKLLGAVPAVSVTVISLVVERSNHSVALFVGLFGLFATFGISLYEIRNTQLYDAAIHRAKLLEQELKLPQSCAGSVTGGLFNERPKRTLRLFGVQVWHDQGLAIVYGAAIGGWIWLTIYSVFALFHIVTELALLPAVLGFILFQKQFLKMSDRNKPQPVSQEKPGG